MIERYEKSLLKIYESEKRKTLKALANSAANKDEKLKSIKEIARRDALDQVNIRSTLGDSGAEQYKALLNKE